MQMMMGDVRNRFCLRLFKMLGEHDVVCNCCVWNNIM